jgi:hypothetical protein
MGVASSIVGTKTLDLGLWLSPGRLGFCFLHRWDRLGVEFFSFLNSARLSSVHLPAGRARQRVSLPPLLGSARHGVILVLKLGSGLIGFGSPWCLIGADLKDRGDQEKFL